MKISIVEQLVARTLGWRARHRRARGRYDRTTLRLFQRAAHHGGAEALVHYLLFRRDLGHALHPRFVEPLCRQLPDLAKHERWLAGALLRESGAAASRVPDVIEWGPGITKAAPNQDDWREGFALAVRSAAAERGVCVVGNSPAVSGQGLGDQIDAAALVIRFNAFRAGNRHLPDTGRRTTVWMTNASYDGPRHDQVDWLVLSGPDMCFRLRDWSDFVARLRRARPVLTVPLHVWRDLVRVLHAPPSAGVLMLAWLHDLLGTWQNVTAVGIGTAGTRRYHLLGRIHGSVRHRWAAEAKLIAHWARQGLTVLPAPAHVPQVAPTLAESLR